MAFAIREIARREGREEVREVAFKSSLRSVYNAIIKSYTNQVIIDITGLSEDYINFLRQKVTELSEKTPEWIEKEAYKEYGFVN